MAALNPKLEVQLGLNKMGLDKGLSGAKGGLMGLDKTVGSVTGKLGRLGSAFASVAKIAAGFVVAQVFLSITRAIGGAIKAASDFQTQMRNVNSIAQLGETQFGALNDQVLELALNPQIKDGPAVLAAGLYDIVSSGFDATDALVILKAASIAASAGLTTTATSSAAITAVLNAYGLQAKDAAAVSDALFQTVNLGVLTFDELANSIGQILPVANSAGVSLNELGAAYATLTRQGVDADLAATEIKNLIVGIVNPSEDLAQAYANAGIESGEWLLKTKGLGGALDFLNSIIGGSTAKATQYFGDIRQQQAVLGLTTRDGKLYIEMLDGMGDAQEGAGATQKALNEQMKSSAFQIAVLKKNLQVLAILGFGAIARPLNFVVRGLSKFVLALIRVGQYVKQVLKGVTTVTKSFGAMGTGITETSSNVKDALAKVPGPLRGIAVAFGNVVKGVQLWGGAMIDAFQSGTKVSDIVKRFPPSLQGLAKDVLLVADSFGDLFAAFRSGGFSGLVDQFGEEIPIIQKALGGLAHFTIDAVVDIGKWALGSVPDLYQWLVNAFTGNTGSHGDKRNLGRHSGGGDTHIPIGDLIIDVGEFLIGAIAGWASSAIPTVQTWLDTNPLSGFTQIIRVDSLKPTFDDLVLLDYQKAIHDFITADPIVVTPEMDLRIQQAVEDWVRDHKDISIDFSTLKDIVLGGLAVAFPVEAISLWLGAHVIPDLVKVIRDVFVGAFRGAFGGEDIPNAIQGSLVAAGTTHTNGIWEDVKAALTPDFSDIGVPTLPSWLTDFTWITGPVGDLVQAIEGAVSDLKNAWNDLRFWQDSTANGGPPATPDNPVNPTQIPSSQPGMVGGELVTALPGTGTGSGISIPVPDFSGALKAITDFTASASAAFVGMRLTVSTTMGGLQGELGKQWAGIRANTLATAQQVQQQTGAIFAGMRADLLGIVGSLQAGAAGIFAGMRSDLVGISASIRGGVAGQFAGMRGDVLGILGGLAYSAGAGGYQIGDALGSGIYYGMAAWVSSIANLAANTVYGAIAAADAAAGHPHSPSPVTRKHIGSPLGEGIFAGIMDWQRPIGNAMAGLVPVGGSASRARSLNAMPTAPRIAMQNSRGATRPVIVHQTVKIERAYGIDDLAVQMAPALNQGLTEVLREVRRARGVAA